MSLEDAIGLGPRHLPSLHIGFCGGKDTQRNQCGQVLARAGGLCLAWPRASAPRLVRYSGFIAVLAKVEPNGRG